CCSSDLAPASLSALDRHHREIPRREPLGVGVHLVHPAVALEDHALLHHHHRRLDVAEDARRALELDALGGRDVADDLAVDEHLPGANVPVHDSLVADDQHVGGRGLTRVAMVRFMTPLSPMINMSVDEISPLNRPFSMTVPLNVYRPSISEPSSMKAVRPLRLMGLRLRLNMVGPSGESPTYRGI